MEAYAKHFDLYKDIVFDATLTSVSRSKDDSKWRVDLIVDGVDRSEEFDKVAFCHGYQNKAKMPHFDGIEKFGGEVIHGQAFKEYITVPSTRSVGLLIKHQCWTLCWKTCHHSGCFCECLRSCIQSRTYRIKSISVAS
jgi:hypothetical protein